MSEKTLKFLAKVENYKPKKVYRALLFSILGYVVEIILAFYLMPYGNQWFHGASFLIISPVAFMIFWGSISTIIKEKKYGDRLVRLSIVAFLGIVELISRLYSFYIKVIIGEYTKSSESYIIIVILFVVFGIVGWLVGKKLAKKLEEKGFSQQNNQDF